MDLLERFATGDTQAFERLFQEFHGEVYRWLARLTRRSCGGGGLDRSSLLAHLPGACAVRHDPKLRGMGSADRIERRGRLLTARVAAPVCPTDNSAAVR